jgi:hypothetical protein
MMMRPNPELYCHEAAAVQNGGKHVIAKRGASVEILKQINKKLDRDSKEKGLKKIESN